MSYQQTPNDNVVVPIDVHSQPTGYTTNPASDLMGGAGTLQYNDKPVAAVSSWPKLIYFIVLALSVAFVVAVPPAAGILVLPFFFTIISLYTVGPNEARVLTFFGKYVGTESRPGVRFAPLLSAKTVSLRTRVFESDTIKANDHDANPIEASIVVTWRVKDAARAVLSVEDYDNYIHTTVESALRDALRAHPYVAHTQGTIALSTHTEEVAADIANHCRRLVDVAGLEIISARISHLAYAKEIASMMLQQQQARATVLARREIVEGAVGLVEEALARLRQESFVTLTAPETARLTTNLLTVLCGERHAQPVLDL